ncbi:hypothetical protein, conserved [Cyanidioschyzon merolae strain 10D]|uniref:tRNA threonylcarbamoyladenosine biosynthesis protein TsaE n=1 Tax=Cyanidioschyzon merolae (strain NIES-3377 / 10D) TaxID=280699 RepID=M1UWH4_CYAM1|nr:hypothetical protein, conserved [Cyanidioschyzon merolae strain 10D]BAM82576.1 hypothetical protein, conserved [Cyanidioschyzon merolae strain 10D]|eukprot:XP_005538612.1 hypothetical protein, conserved [Cyanidioschyzon merolae strain 10D]
MRRNTLSGFLPLLRVRARKATVSQQPSSMSVFAQYSSQQHQQCSSIERVSCRRFRLESPPDTWRLGAALARLARPGDVFLLQGSLGAGKTTLARGFIQEFLNDPELEVVSPTYLLDVTYPDYENKAKVPGVVLHHLDLYRLENADDRPIADFADIFTHQICLVEWPERLGKYSTPEEFLQIRFSFVAGADGPRVIESSGFASHKHLENPRWSQARIDQIQWQCSAA